MTRKKIHHRGAVLAGVGMLVAAAALGGRFLYSKASKKQRKKIEGWAQDLKEDSIAILGDAAVVSRKTYLDAVDRASKKYRIIKSIDAKDVARAVKEIKGHWREVEARVKKSAKTVKKVAKKKVRKVTSTRGK